MKTIDVFINYFIYWIEIYWLNDINETDINWYVFISSANSNTWFQLDPIGFNNRNSSNMCFNIK